VNDASVDVVGQSAPSNVVSTTAAALQFHAVDCSSPSSPRGDDDPGGPRPTSPQLVVCQYVEDREEDAAADGDAENEDSDCSGIGDRGSGGQEFDVDTHGIQD